MLDSMGLRDVGPVKNLQIDLAQRLNFVTGDNGLGKTFLLDMAWYGITRSWAGWPARPDKGRKGEMTFKVGQKKITCSYHAEKRDWIFSRGAPLRQGILLYAQVDGGFSVWDPDRNAAEDDEKAPAFHFSAREIWYGLSRTVSVGKEKIEQLLCNGLLQDLIIWQTRGDRQFELFKGVLQVMSPLDEPIRLGVPMRLGNGDPREYPTLLNHDDVQIPIIHASAAFRRILSLSYLLLWAWQEHVLVRENKPARNLLFLIDELEAHLHPRWQRTIVPCLLQVANQLLGRQAEVQFLAVTHSPLILASLEPQFNPKIDRVWALERTNSVVSLEQKTWLAVGMSEVGFPFWGLISPIQWRPNAPC